MTCASQAVARFDPEGRVLSCGPFLVRADCLATRLFRHTKCAGKAAFGDLEMAGIAKLQWAARHLRFNFPVRKVMAARV